jgi:hypothetical protein
MAEPHRLPNAVLRACSITVIAILIDINNYLKNKAYFYITLRLVLYNLILRLL